MDREQFVREVAERTGLGQDQADRAIQSSLGVLGQRLFEAEAAAVAAELPTPYSDMLRRGRYERELDEAELYDRVAAREGVEVGFAREHAQVVFQVVARALSHDAGLLLRKHLGPPLAALFVPREAPPAPERPDHTPQGHPSTLAEGRPGSRHPISEAHLDRAQAHSVVREDNPHGDTKLSSSGGLTQERLQESLATGKPPAPKRPLSRG